MKALTAVFFLLYLSPMDDLKNGTGGSLDDDNDGDDDGMLVAGVFLDELSSFQSDLDSTAPVTTFTAALPSILLAEPLNALNLEFSAVSSSVVIYQVHTYMDLFKT